MGLLGRNRPSHVFRSYHLSVVHEMALHLLTRSYGKKLSDYAETQDADKIC